MNDICIHSTQLGKRYTNSKQAWMNPGVSGPNAGSGFASASWTLPLEESDGNCNVREGEAFALAELLDSTDLDTAEAFE